jgi:hypothetical protein
MEFNFNATTMSFSLATIQNAVNISSFCFRCTRVAFQTWSQLQVRAVVVSSGCGQLLSVWICYSAMSH